METSYVKEVKRNFRGNLLNYISFLEKEKSGSAQSTASLYKVTLGHLERYGYFKNEASDPPVGERFCILSAIPQFES